MPVTTTSIQTVGGLDEIVAPGVTLERVLTGFEFVEGPAWDPRNNTLVFSDIIGDTLYCWSDKTGLDILRRPSHMANGNTWDRQGRLLSCEHARSRISRSALKGDYEVLVSHFQGRELNSPNDIVVSASGRVYFTDPNSGRSAKFGVERSQQLGFQGVYMLEPDASELTLLVDDFEKPNGLCFSPNESLLYVNDTDLQHIRVFDVSADGLIDNGQDFASVAGDEPGVADGMKVDSAGNLYCCGSGGIHVFDSKGTRKGIIRTPEFAANFTWGGEQLKDLYITASHSIYRLRTAVSGRTLFDPE